MAVKSSPETVRQMQADIRRTAQELERISQMVQTAVRASSGWDDDQSVQFLNVMREIAGLVQAPVPTLEEAVPRLERLAQALDAYGSVRF